MLRRYDELLFEAQDTEPIWWAIFKARDVELLFKVYDTEPIWWAFTWGTWDQSDLLFEVQNIDAISYLRHRMLIRSFSWNMDANPISSLKYKVSSQPLISGIGYQANLLFEDKVS